MKSPPKGPASVMAFTSEASEFVRCSGIRATRNLVRGGSAITPVRGGTRMQEGSTCQGHMASSWVGA